MDINQPSIKDCYPSVSGLYEQKLENLIQNAIVVYQAATQTVGIKITSKKLFGSTLFPQTNCWKGMDY